MTERDFYRRRDRRSVEYGVADEIFMRPVTLFVGDDAAESPRGQLLVLALVNMLARLHRQLAFSIPACSLLEPRALGRVPTTAHMTLDEAAVAVARAINPFIRFGSPDTAAVGAALGVGSVGANAAPWHVHVRDNLVCVDRQPLPFDDGGGSSLGPCFAACLSAWVLFAQIAGLPIVPRRVSAWDLREDDQVVSGPATLPPLDVGRCLVIGAGGVGSSLGYWLSLVGVSGNWLVVDGDQAELHNTNRSMGMLAADAGWPTAHAVNKANIAADLIGATARPCWFNELGPADLAADLVLPLANERGVRGAISQRGDAVVLHATTSRNYESQLHRHISGRDDCILCRLPPGPGKVQFECSTVSLGDGANSTDAALPFLSATAAVMLVSSLYRLMAGELQRQTNNWDRVVFRSTGKLIRSGRCACRGTCPGILPPAARAVAQRDTRWSYLDQASAAARAN